MYHLQNSSAKTLAVLTTLYLLVVVSLLTPAPVPQPRVKATSHIEPGHYEILWGNTLFIMHLSSDGGYYCEDSWLGTWNYHRTTRQLTIKERITLSSSYTEWSVVLDQDLKGMVTMNGPTSIQAHIIPLGVNGKPTLKGPRIKDH